MRTLLIALALCAAAAPAAANPCREQARVRAQAEVGAAWPLPTDTTDVKLSDYGYDVGYLLAGGRVAAAVRPISCFELGAVARHVRIDEGRARDGSVLHSEGTVAAGLFGFRLRLTDLAELAMLIEVGSTRTEQTLRDTSSTGRAIGFAGRDEMVIGRGATAFVVAFDITAYIFEPQMTGGLAPRLSGIGLYLGVTHRL